MPEDLLDRLGGLTVTRPGWEQLLAYVRPGDTLIVTELSRMSRSLVHLLEVVKECEARELELISLREKIDTTSATGRAFLAIMGAIAQMERELKAERTAAGRAAAKARGRTGGPARIPTHWNKLGSCISTRTRLPRKCGPSGLDDGPYSRTSLK